MGLLQRLGEHPGAPETIELGASTLVGRRPPCDVQIDESSLTRQHAIVAWRRDHWEILDLESLNGTRVNGRRLARGEAARLEVGSEVVFGQMPVWCLVSDAPPEW